MQSVQQVQELIQKLLSSKSNVEVKSLEETFKKYKKQNSNQFIMDMLTFISDDSLRNDLKTFAINEIRTSLSDYAKSTSPITLQNINQETVDMLQNILMNQVTIEQNYQLRKLICETIGEIGSSLLNRSMWNGLLDLLWALFEQQKLEIQQSAFIILRILIQYSQQVFVVYLNELNTLLGNGLIHADLIIKVEAIKTLGVLLEQLERKQCKNFTNLSIKFLESVYSVLIANKTSQGGINSLNIKDIDDNESVTSVANVVFDITEQEPSFFKNDFSSFYIAINKMIEEYPKPAIQRIFIESLINLVERFSDQFENSQDQIENILHLILLQMVQVDDEITEEWMNPQSGFNDDLENDERSETIRFGQNMINQYIPCFEDNTMIIQLIITNIKKMFDEENNKQDWRYPHAAMMIFSQLGEFIDDIEQIAPLLKLTYEYSFNHQNPLIRYAFCQVIGQISEDMAPLFQETYGNELLPKLIEMFKDNIPRVRAHAAAAIVNFTESMNEDIIKPHLESLLEGLFKLIDGDVIIEKEAAVTALSSTIESSKGYFEKHLLIVMHKLLEHIKSSINKQNLQQFCGNIFECVSIASNITRKAAFVPYLGNFIEILFTYTDYIKDQQNHQNKYIFDSWNRLAHKYNEEISPLLPRIMPQLILLIENILIVENKDEASLDTEEIQSAIRLITVFADKFSTQLSSYVDNIYEIIQDQTQSKNEQIRETACRSLPQLLRCIKNDPEKMKNFLKEIIKTLRDAIDSEYEAQLIIVQLESMKLCIQEGNEFMSEMEFEFLSNQLMKILQESDRRKQKFQELINDNELEQIQKQLIPSEYKTEEKLHIEIAHVLGSLYKSHQEQALNFSASIYTNILPKAFNDPSQVMLLQFGMILLQDIVRHIGFVRFYQKWDEIINIFLTQLDHQSLLIKKEALHGLSCIVISTPSQILHPHLTRIQNIAIEFIKQSGIFIDETTKQIVNNNLISVFKQTQKVNSLKEYAIDILGKLLKLHGSLLDNDALLTQLWIQSLPIQTEKKIADDQHQIYLQYLIINQSLIQNQTKENIQKIFQLLSEFYDPKICTSFMRPILNQFLFEFLENHTISELYNSIYNNLTKIQQKRLKNAYNNSKAAEQKKQEQILNQS